MVDLLTREYEVNYSHIDNRGIAKPSFLWNIMQDAATVHAEALHIGPLDLRIVWVLSRMKARLTRPLLPYERLRCETWCLGIKGASWYRSFSFFVDNKPVGDAQSMWVTLDPETHRIVRPSAFPEAEQYLHTSRGELFAPLPKLSCDNVRLHHVHEVNYTAETACGESLSLLTGTADSARYIRGEADGRTRFEALATLSPLPDPKEGLV